MQHEDFIITMTDVHEIVEDGTRKVMFRVAVPGRVTEGQETGYDKSALTRPLSNWETVPPNLSKVINLGLLLGDALFPQGPVRDAFLGSLSVHKHDMDSRLRVVLNMAPELQLVPWEFALFHTEHGEATQNEMLGLMSQVSIVRQLDSVVPNLKGVGPATHPVRMVMALADPKGTLDLEEERRIVEDSLKDTGRVQVTYVEDATSDTLLGGLDEVHLFQFSGHGTFVERNVPGATFGTGALILDDESSPLSAPLVATRLVTAGVRVAVLGACLTAKGDQVQMWSSTAANLINGGLGAVVGMQYVIADKSAIAFTRAFYEALALGFPVDQAVTKGRIAIFELGDCRGFGTPVLYMGDCDGVVFPEFTDDPVLIEERAKLRLLVNLSVGVVEGTVTGIEVEKMSEGQAKADITAVEVEGGELTGFEGGSLTGGDVDVKIKVGDVKKGSKVVGISAEEVGGGSLSSQQTAENVSGNLTGVQIGELGGTTTVKQDAGTVESGGTVTGAILGSEDSHIHVGGTETHETVYCSSPQTVDTGGGAYIGGNMTMGGGSFAGRDHNVTMDQVGRDKFVLGEGSTLIITTGDVPASNNQPKPLLEEAIRLDVAAPPTVPLDEPFDLAVAVRQPGAPALAIEELTQVLSEEGRIFRSEKDEVVTYRIEVTGSGAVVRPPSYRLRLRPGENSRPYFFQVTLTRPGRRSLVVNAYQEDETLAAQTRVRIDVEVEVQP